MANPDLLLKPGMTATAAIITAERDNVLRVPLQALRFTPAGADQPTGGRPAAHRRRRPDRTASGSCDGKALGRVEVVSGARRRHSSRDQSAAT